MPEQLTGENIFHDNWREVVKMDKGLRGVVRPGRWADVIAKALREVPEETRDSEVARVMEELKEVQKGIGEEVRILVLGGGNIERISKWIETTARRILAGEIESGRDEFVRQWAEYEDRKLEEGLEELRRRREE